MVAVVINTILVGPWAAFPADGMADRGISFENPWGLP